jgi:hypothetical protein
LPWDFSSRDGWRSSAAASGGSTGKRQPTAKVTKEANQAKYQAGQRFQLLLKRLGPDHKEVQGARAKKTEAEEEVQRHWLAWRESLPLPDRVQFAKKQVETQEKILEECHKATEQLEDQIAELQKQRDAIQPKGDRAYHRLAEAKEYLAKVEAAQAASGEPEGGKGGPTTPTPSADVCTTLTSLVTQFAEAANDGDRPAWATGEEAHGKRKVLLQTIQASLPSLTKIVEAGPVQAAAPPPSKRLRRMRKHRRGRRPPRSHPQAAKQRPSPWSPRRLKGGPRGRQMGAARRIGGGGSAAT